MTPRKQFGELPEGYSIRRLAHGISPGTSRKLTEGAESALYEIASASPRWTEWGEGHVTSMYSGACERRGYIEVALPAKPSQGRTLFRATPAGVKLANTWRKLRGEEEIYVADEGIYVRAAIESFKDQPPPTPSAREFARAMIERDPKRGARGDEWPESLGTWELHDAIRAEPNTDRLSMLNEELKARLG